MTDSNEPDRDPSTLDDQKNDESLPDESLKSVSPFSFAFWIILPIRFYQKFLNPLLRACVGDCCRFEPSCSHYFIQAVKKYGVFRGCLKGIWRILRCNPWCRGGYDPP